jgi:hypothetical protein
MREAEKGTGGRVPAEFPFFDAFVLFFGCFTMPLLQDDICRTLYAFTASNHFFVTQ